METFELKQTLLKQRCLTCNEEFPPDSDLKSCPVDGSMLSPVFDDPFIGTVIDGKYEVVERIAIGAKAKIYKAKHLHLDKFVALKVLQVGIAVTQAQVARFQKEAQVAVRLIHPNIVRVYDYGTHPQPYIVMEYVDGKTLAVLIKESGALPAQRALPYFIEIGNAMCAAHASGLVHRDLKPSNVIIDSESGQAKVLDFGLVKDFIDDAHYTKTGDIVGSPSYMSPEQWKGQPLDGRSDIYSLGCLIYEVLTGLAPFAAANPVECMFKHLEAKPAKLTKARRDLKFPPGMDVIIGNCLAKDKNNRYRSMTELTKDLLAVQAGKGRKLKPHDRFKTVRLVIGGWVALQVLLFSLCILALVYQNWNRPQWQKTLEQASALQEQGDFAGSLPLLKEAERGAKAAQAAPRPTEDIYWYLGQAYMRTDQPEKALAPIYHALELNKLHEEDVPRSFCHELLSDTYFKMEDYEKALEHGKAAVEIASRQSNNMYRMSDCWYCVAVAQRELGRNSEALVALQTSRDFAVKPHFIPKGDANGPLNRLIKYMGEAVAPPGGEGNPELMNIDSALGDCYHRLHRDSDSLKAYGRALRHACELDPDRAPAIAGELAPLLKDDKFMGLIDEISVEEHWQPYLTAFVRGLGFKERGDYAQAVTELDEAFKEGPNSPGLRAWIAAWIGSGLMEQKNYAQAINEFDKALGFLKSGPSYLSTWTGLLSWIYINKGYCQLESGMPVEALANYRQAIAIDKNYTCQHPYIAYCLDQMKRYDEAAKEWTEAIRTEPHNSSHYFSRAVTYLAMGKFKESSEDAARFLQLKNWQTDRSVYAAILLILAYRLEHNDRAAEKALLTYEQKNAPKSWPYPVIRYLGGHATVDDLKKASGNDISKLTETYCYLGLDSLAKGKRDQAREHLQWVVDHGLKNYLEYELATAFLDYSKK